MYKKIFIPFIIVIITSFLLIILGCINIIKINYNNNNIALNDNIIETHPKFYVTYDQIEIYQEINRYNRLVALFKKNEKEEEIIPVKYDIKADIKLIPLKNKLKYFDSYSVQYKSQYLIYPKQENIKRIKLIYKIPSKRTVFDDFKININNNELKDINLNTDTNEIINDIQYKQGEINKIEISYIAKGSKSWKYYFGENINKLIDFNLELRTNFKKIIFPENCISTVINKEFDDSIKLRWNYKNLLFGFNIGIEMPQMIDPGKLAAQITFSGIISLLLFFIFLFFSLLYNNKEFRILDYLFLAISFFIFYLTFSFTVQFFNVFVTLLIAVLISLLISGFYIFYKNGIRFTILYISIPQFIYSGVLSFSLFFEGIFGLTLTIVIIITTIIVMIMNNKTFRFKQNNQVNENKIF